MKIFHVKFSTAILLLYFISSVCIIIFSGKYKRFEILNWDISGYHIYNPAVFIYNDIEKISFYDHIDSLYQPTKGRKVFPGSVIDDFGTVVLKYTSGVAFLQMPFFLIAQAYCYFDSRYPNDGYSAPFQLSVAFSNILFGLLGLIILRAFLAYYFNDFIIGITIAIIAFGTNFFIYSNLHPGLSHIYLFFFYSITLLATKKWHEKPSFLNSVILGISIGWAGFIRPTDFLLILIPIFWNILPAYSRHEKIKLLKKSAKLVGITAIFVILPFFIQMIYWKYITGNWLYWSYHGEKFDFLNSHIIKGLFSFRKGWFLYTPLALLGLMGLFVGVFRKKQLFYVFPIWIYFALTIYIVFSWEQWFYGGSFGCRVLIQTLALLAYPIALIVQAALRKSKAMFAGLLLFILSGIALNLFQTWQYHTTVIHWSDMSKEYYKRVFLKKHPDQEDYQFLGTDNDK